MILFLGLSSQLTFGQLNDDQLKIKVTFESSAVNGIKLVKALAKASRVNLSASPQLEKDIVMVRAVEIPLVEIMSKIASVTSGEWKLSDGKYTLFRSKETEKKEAKVELEQRIAGLIQSNKIRGEQFARLGTSNAHMTYVGKAALRILPQLIDRTDLSELAKMQVGDRLVLSSNPTPMQMPLNRSFDEVLDSITSNFNLFKTPIQRAQTSSSILSNFKSLMPVVPPIPETRKPKALLVVTRESVGLTFCLNLYDGRGIQFISQAITIYDNGLSAATPHNSGYSKIAGPDKALKVSELTLNIERWFGPNGDAKKATEIEISKLVETVENEPLGFQVSDSLLEVSKFKNINLVANLPDNLGSMFDGWPIERPKTVNEYLGWILKNRNLKVNLGAEWLEINPSKPSETRDTRLNRSSFSKLLRSCNGTRNVRLDALADFVTANSLLYPPAITIPYFLMFCPNALDMGDASLDWDMLRFYGSLNDSQRKDFRAQKAISFEFLSPVQLVLAEKMAFNSSMTMNRLDSRIGSKLSELPYPTWKLEPTELFPNGIPKSTVLQVVTSSRTVGIYSGSSVDAAMEGSLEAPRFGGILNELETTLPKWKSEFSLRLGTRIGFKCDFLLRGEILMRKFLCDDIYEIGAAGKSWDELPEAFRDEIAKASIAINQRKTSSQNKQGNPPPS